MTKDISRRLQVNGIFNNIVNTYEAVQYLEGVPVSRLKSNHLSTVKECKRVFDLLYPHSVVTFLYDEEFDRELVIRKSAEVRRYEDNHEQPELFLPVWTIINDLYGKAVEDLEWEM
jgi:hypothetical protein